LEVLVRGVALLLAGVAALIAGCGRTAAVTDTAAVSAAPAAAAAALPLTEAEHDFVAALAAERIGENIDVRTLVGYGNTACTALSADTANPEAATAAVKSAAPLDDATAQAIIQAATDHLCPSASTAGGNTTPSAAALAHTTSTTSRRSVA
jgi:uncharacterized protein DUF732